MGKGLQKAVTTRCGVQHTVERDDFTHGGGIEAVNLASSRRTIVRREIGEQRTGRGTGVGVVVKAATILVVVDAAEGRCIVAVAPPDPRAWAIRGSSCLDA